MVNGAYEKLYRISVNATESKKAAFYSRKNKTKWCDKLTSFFSQIEANFRVSRWPAPHQKWPAQQYWSTACHNNLSRPGLDWNKSSQYYATVKISLPWCSVSPLFCWRRTVPAWHPWRRDGSPRIYLQRTYEINQLKLKWKAAFVLIYKGRMKSIN